MNERIKILATDAGLSDFFAPNQKHRSKDLEKFAELIIRECSKVCYKVGVLEMEEEIGWKYGDAIQEQFGIK